MTEDHNELRRIEAERWWQMQRDALLFSKEYGAATIGSLITINGGAIIAFLSFLAAGISTVIAHDEALLLAVRALTCFGISLILPAIAAGLGYINFSAISESLPNPQSLTSYTQTGVASGWRIYNKTIFINAWLAVILVATSAVLFLVGAYFSLETLRALRP